MPGGWKRIELNRRLAQWTVLRGLPNPRSIMIAQSHDELRRHLDEHIGFLKTSAKLYDEGQIAEAKRLAATIRTLLHDTRKSKSLLGQLNRKTELFVDSATGRMQMPAVVTSYTGLVGTTLGDGPSEFLPNLHNSPSRLVPFEKWWSAPVIIDSQQREISRERLILAVCNKDGGVHVDPELDEVYADLSRNDSLGRQTLTEGKLEPIIGVEHASVRQVAHELLRMLDPSFEPVPKANPPPFVIGNIGLVLSS